MVFFFPLFFLAMLVLFKYVAFEQNERIDDVASTASDFCLELKGLPVHFELSDLKDFIEREGRLNYRDGQNIKLNVIQIIVPGRINDDPRVLNAELRDLKLQMKSSTQISAEHQLQGNHQYH